jgi:hydrogenase maturation protease
MMNERHDTPAPVLVLALGNLLLRDDAIGLFLLDELRALRGSDTRVEFVDGGTQGLALVGLFEGRSAVLMLDAVQQGAAPGTVHHLEDALRRVPNSGASSGGGAHQMNAGDLLLTASLLGEVPERVMVVGIEPEVVRTGIGLSPAVLASVPQAVNVAHHVLLQLLATEAVSCTS